MIKLVNLAPEKLDSFVFEQHPEANFLQTANWGKVYELSGDKVFYWGFYDRKRLVGSCLAILKPAKRGHYLEIPGGPLLEWGDDKLCNEIVQLIKQEAKINHCVFVRMRPNIADSETQREQLKKMGLVLSPMHLHAEHTVMLDLTQPLETLMDQMRRQTRYEVRRSHKLKIAVSSDSSQEAFNSFYSLQLETAKRQGFIPSSREFILNQQRAFGDKARIYTATLDGNVLAKGLILLQAPEAIYHEAASTDDGRKYPGAYALQWQVIQDAKRLGLKRYNLFGIAPPNSPKHRYAGVTTFKTGFGGEIVNYLPAHDLVVDGMRYKIVKLVEDLRRRHRHL